MPEPANRSAGDAAAPRLRLLVLSWRDERHPEAGGAEVFLQKITGGLSTRGHDVTVMSARYPGSLPREHTVDGRRMVRRGGRFSVYGWGMWEASLAGRWYDAIIDIQNGVPFWSPLVTRVPVVNVVHHVHREQWGEVFDPLRSRLGWLLESRAAPAVYRRARYLAVSQATRDDLLALGVAPDRVGVITSGLDAPECPVTYDPAADPTLVVLGRLVPHKRVEIAIDAIAALRGEFPGIRLEVLGQGYWAEELRRYAERRGVADRVRFAGFVSEEEKVRLLATARVNLLPSLKEGWGLAVVEAGILGTPTVAFRDAGGVTESIVDGVTGVLASDPTDFIAAVGEIVRDADLRRQLGAKARLHASQFDWEATTDAVERVLLTEVAGRRASRET